MSRWKSSTAGIATSKRSACDRCRSQKLRCPPRDDATQACMRCIRVGAECTTSYSQSLGRCVVGRVPAASELRIRSPVVPGVSLRPMSIEQQETEGAFRPGFQLPISQHPPAISQHKSTATDREPWSWQPMAENQNRGSAFHDPYMFSFSKEDFNLYRDIPPALASSLRNDDSGDQARLLYGSSEITLQGHSSMPSVDRKQNNSDSTGTGTGTGAWAMPEPNFSNKGIQRSKSTLPGIKCDPRLSRLGWDLSRQLEACLSGQEPWDPMSLDLGLLEDQEDKAMSQEGSYTPTSFGEALNSISDYVAIIQSYSTSDRPSSKPREYFPSQQANLPSLSITIILNLLSAYLQIVAIFDSLCLHLAERLGEKSDGTAAGLQTLPGLSIAGFSVDNGKLQTKILMQTIIHQFELIERLLGLPPGLCVSNKRDNSTGLLGDQRGKTLVEALVPNNETQVHIDGIFGMKALGSLREQLRLLQSS